LELLALTETSKDLTFADWGAIATPNYKWTEPGTLGEIAPSPPETFNAHKKAENNQPLLLANNLLGPSTLTPIFHNSTVAIGGRFAHPAEE